MGKLIVLEGTDGSGKSTQFQSLCQRLQKDQIPFEMLRFHNIMSLPLHLLKCI